MKKPVDIERDPAMLDEYDFSQDVRGKYVEHFTQGRNVTVLSSDTAAILPDSESFNEEFDYTQWRQTLLAELSGEEVSRRAMEYRRRKPVRGVLAKRKAK